LLLNATKPGLEVQIVKAVNTW